MSYQAPPHGPLPGSEAEGLVWLPPSLNSPERCGEHEESLSMFCLDDLEPLCKRCAAASHAGHRVYLSNEAAIDCKEELRISVNGLNKKMIHFKQVSQTCEHTSKYNQASAKLTEEHMKTEFEKLHQFLREEEAARLLALREEQEEKKRAVEERMDRINQVIKSMEGKIQLIEEELNAGGNGVQFLQEYRDKMNSTWTRNWKPKNICRPLIDVAKHLGNLRYAVWEKMKHIATYTPVTLDPRTACQSLRVSPRLDSAQIIPVASQGPEETTVPANPERFHPYSCVVAAEGFSTGVHCWDVEVSDTNNWTLGVAARSLSRREEFEAFPEGGLWCISLRDGEYRALTTPSEILHLDDSRHLNRVRVKLDWDGGMLEFMDADMNAHLFTFRHRFAEKVYPYFESISVGGSLALLAQNLNISVGSNYAPVEDTVIATEDQVVKSESSIEKSITTAMTNNNNKIGNGHLSEEKKSAVGSVRQQRTTKPAKKEKTSKNKTGVKKQSSKARFNVTYHVSLNRALNNINIKCGGQNANPDKSC